MQVHVIWNITDWYAAWIWYLELEVDLPVIRVLWKAAWKFVNRIIHHKLQTRAWFTTTERLSAEKMSEANMMA